MERICQNCNRPNSAEAAFCRHCASPLTAPATGARQPETTPPPRQDQNWGQPAGAGQNARNATGAPAGSSQKALLALGLAAGGLLCCGPITGIPAAILGWLEINAIKEGRSPRDGMWMAQVGLWGGIAVSILGVIGWFFMLLLSMSSGPAY